MQEPRHTVGMILSEARQSAGVTLKDSAELLKIRRVYLEAFETDNHAALPEIVFSVGFLRTYANYLGLDEEALIRQFRAESRAALASDRPQLYFPKPALEEKGPGVIVLLVAGVLLVGALLAWTLSWRDDGAGQTGVEPVPDRLTSLVDEVGEPPLPPAGEGVDDAEPGARSPTFERLVTEPTAGEPGSVEDAATGTATGPITALDEPVPEEPVAEDTVLDEVSEEELSPPSEVDSVSEESDRPATADGATADGVTADGATADGTTADGMEVYALADSWVEITAPDGSVTYSGVLGAGQSIAVSDDSGVMVTGNAGGIELRLDGRSTGPLGETGDVLRDVAFDLETVRQRWFIER